jgi:hypothetical protein
MRGFGKMLGCIKAMCFYKMTNVGALRYTPSIPSKLKVSRILTLLGDKIKLKYRSTVILPGVRVGVIQLK